MKPENKIPVIGLLSPVFRQILDVQNGLPSVPLPVGDGYFPAMRRAYSSERQYWNRGGPALYTIQDHAVMTPLGPIDTRIYRPHAVTPATIFYLHGGGFIVGNLDTHDRIMRLLAEYTGCAVIGINYTLSPEAKYPQAIEEIVAVCQSYSSQSGIHHLNMANIGFAGDSAGAMLSLACALWLRDHHINCGKVCGLLLWYGLYGLEDSSTRRLYGGPWDGLSQSDLQEFEHAYLQGMDDRESPWYCLFNNDLTRDVPPCFIAGAEFDPLLDDSLTLYRTLNGHGLRVRYCLYSGMLHGFLHYSRILPAADNALRDGADYFRQQLASHQ